MRTQVQARRFGVELETPTNLCVCGARESGLVKPDAACRVGAIERVGGRWHGRWPAEPWWRGGAVLGRLIVRDKRQSGGAKSGAGGWREGAFGMGWMRAGAIACPSPSRWISCSTPRVAPDDDDGRIAARCLPMMPRSVMSRVAELTRLVLVTGPCSRAPLVRRGESCSPRSQPLKSSLFGSKHLA